MILFSYIILAIITLSTQAQQQFSGKATFYDPSGRGACGDRINADELLVGITKSFLNKVPCGSCLEVRGPKGTVVVKVKDECPGCDFGDVDLSRKAFARIADLKTGIVQVTSRVVSCSGDNSSERLSEQARPNKTTSKKPNPSKTSASRSPTPNVPRAEAATVPTIPAEPHKNVQQSSSKSTQPKPSNNVYGWFYDTERQKVSQCVKREL